MATLTGTTVVRHPDTLAPIVLAAGAELPEWAAGLVGDHLIDSGEDVPAEAGVDYSRMVKADLLQLIADRNADRDDEHQIVPESDKNDHLVAALTADDAAA